MFNGALASEQEVKNLLDAQAKKTKSFSSGVDFDMSEQVISELRDRNKELELKLSEAVKKLDDLGAEAVQAKLDAKDHTIGSLNEEITTLKAEISSLKSEAEKLEKSKTDLEAAKADAESKLQEAEDQISQAEAEALKTSRISTLVDKGVEKAVAEELVTNFGSLDDDQFANIVAMQTELVEAKCGKNKEEEEKEDKAKASEETETEEEEAGDETAGSEILEEAEEEETEASMATESETNGSEEVMHSIASFISDNYLNK
jgi:hypothetical protein